METNIETKHVIRAEYSNEDIQQLIINDLKSQGFLHSEDDVKVTKFEDIQKDMSTPYSQYDNYKFVGISIIVEREEI